MATTFVRYDKGKVVRRYSPKWNELNGPQYSRAIDVIKGQLSQREHMIAYIEALHNTIDRLNKKVAGLK